MTALLDQKMEIEQEVFLKLKDKFTDDNGVFDYKGACAWYERPRP
jgi:hypothetical protein